MLEHTEPVRTNVYTDTHTMNIVLYGAFNPGSGTSDKFYQFAHVNP